MRGIGLQGSDAAPTIIERVDQDFIAAILETLEQDGGLATVLNGQATRRDSAGVLKLFQPVQRTFNVVLFEAVCDEYSPYAQPRLDPARIDSAGLVLRRRAVDQSGHPLQNQWEGWRQAGKAFRGWVPFAGLPAQDLDPTAERRPKTSTGHPTLDRQVARYLQIPEPLSETVSPLFTAPPQACEVTGKTILYGLIPVTSAELSDTPAHFPPFDLQDVSNPNHLPAAFRSGVSVTVPRAGQTVTSADAEARDLAVFVTMLRQLAVEFDAFGTGAAARALFQELNRLELTISHASTTRPAVTRPAGEFLQEAVRVLLEKAGADETPPRNLSITMPVAWPSITGQQEQRLVQRIQAAMSANLATTVPRAGRFDDLASQYQIRGFIRVRRDDGCPPDLVWSGYSEPFSIAPWYASNNAPPMTVQLPDAFDRNLLKSLKPNVTFAMPNSMFQMLQGNNPTDVFAGNLNKGSGGIDLGWLCSFSIPIITICAFLVLNIFLQLFDIIFRWMMFIKICIPRPK
jgi:hypothetical protein